MSDQGAQRCDGAASFGDAGGDEIRARDTDLILWPHLRSPPESSARRIYLYKDRRLLSALTHVLDRVAPRRMVEVGVLDGGSTIYWAERYRLDRLVAIEGRADAPFLSQFIDRHGLNDRVRVHFGVLQDDRPALRAIMRRELALFDAVIDDASHWYAQTRATFEALFPFLRPGGVYIIEDWAWGHAREWRPEDWAERPLMSPLLTQLMLVCGRGDGVIESVHIDKNFAAIWRGRTPVPDDGFDISGHYTTRGFALPTDGPCVA
jgi:predicted O-methyltransferase YrrM